MEAGSPQVRPCVVYHGLQNLFRQKEAQYPSHSDMLQAHLLLGIPLCPSVLSSALTPFLPPLLLVSHSPEVFPHSLFVPRPFL